MNYALARDYYMKKQTTALVNEATAHELISLTLQQLVKNLEQYNRADSKTMSRKYKTQALVAIYTLQSSLDFEQGGEIARNLYRLYEFVKSSLSEANEKQKYKVEQSLKLMSEILEAWEEIKKHPKVTVTIDLFWIGIVFFRTEQVKEHFTINPYI